MRFLALRDLAREGPGANSHTVLLIKYQIEMEQILLQSKQMSMKGLRGS